MPSQTVHGIKRILIVDDEKQIGVILAATLSKLGKEYLIDTAVTPSDALELIHTHTYHVVITDYQMPQMNGLELSQIIRQVSPQTQVILMTAYSTDDLRGLADKMRLDGYIDKPFQAEQIRTIVREAVERTRQEPNHIALAIETLNQSEALLQDLRFKTNARCVLFMRAEGHLIAQNGNTQNLDISSISTLVAANFMAASELAKLLGNTDSVFKSSYHEGPHYNVYAYIVNKELLLAVIFGAESKAGVVRFYTHEAAARLLPLLDKMEPKATLDKDLSRLLEDDLNKLFTI